MEAGRPWRHRATQHRMAAPTTMQALTMGARAAGRSSWLVAPGVGLITAVTIRAEIGRFDRFRNGKQLARFCGLSPRNASSGQRQADAGLIKAGNPQLRVALIETAHRLLRFDDRWCKFGGRMLARGKPKCVVIAAMANRWIRGLHHQLASATDTA